MALHFLKYCFCEKNGNTHDERDAPIRRTSVDLLVDYGSIVGSMFRVYGSEHLTQNVCWVSRS